MRRRSLTATLALAFAVTTLAVFAAVGSALYVVLARHIKAQDDLDIVLATQHLKTLAQEMITTTGFREHAERLTSTVFGNPAFFMVVTDNRGRVIIEHNAHARSIAPVRHLAPDARIVAADLTEWHNAQGTPVRGIAADVILQDGAVATVLVARRMTDRALLLDRYRQTMVLAGVAGVLAAFLLGYLLIRSSLRPLRAIAASATRVTVDRLDTRIAVPGVPLELQALVESLNQMLARLDQGFSRLSQFTADLAHDLRTPVSNMRGATEVALARPRSPPEYEALLASNLEECERVSRMIENVLFLARAEHPQFVTHAQPFEVREELLRVAAYFEGLAEEANVALRVDARGSLKADTELFRRAVSNLLANALRYTPPGGEIVLAAAAVGQHVRVMVSNQGAPIDARHLDKIFDRFYRVDPSRSNAAGSTGLGLAIVRTIMDLHGGTVWAESDAQSTRFILQFPGA